MGIPDSGEKTTFTAEDITPEVKPRKIVVAQGIQAHDNDIKLGNSLPLLESLKKKIEKVDPKNTFEIEKIEGAYDCFESVQSVAKYKNTQQKVQFIIITVVSKRDFKKALESEGIHVIYEGHSRYGRGACFDIYPDTYPKEGDQWENGTSEENGIFRLGYPYVPVDFEDFDTHKYEFAAIPVENDPPQEKNEKETFNWHPDIRGKKLQKMSYKEKEYWGVTIGNKNVKHLILEAGWKDTRSKGYDLGSVDLKCKVFCHFGCSSELHFWHIVRKEEYKGWVRPDPPTEKFAYFTKKPSDHYCTMYWLFCILTYNQENANKSWWDSLQWAKKKANSLMGSNLIY